MIITSILWWAMFTLRCMLLYKPALAGETSMWLTFRQWPAHHASDVTDVQTGLFVLDLGRGRSATADNRLNKVKIRFYVSVEDVLGFLRERTQIVLHGKSPETWNRGVIRALSVCASARAAWAVLTGLAPVLSTQDTCFCPFCVRVGVVAYAPSSILSRSVLIFRCFSWLSLVLLMYSLAVGR